MKHLIMIWHIGCHELYNIELNLHGNVTNGLNLTFTKDLMVKKLLPCTILIYISATNLLMKLPKSTLKYICTIEQQGRSLEKVHL